MRSVFTPATMPMRDRVIFVSSGGIESGKTDRSIALGESSKGLLRAAISTRLPRQQIQGAVLTLTVLGRLGKPTWIGIGRLLRRVDYLSATWGAPSPGFSWAGSGGVEGADYTTIRALSLVPPSASHQVQIDVTEDLRAWVSGGAQNCGWVLTGDAVVAGVRSLVLATVPKLDVRYSVEQLGAASPLAGLADVGG